MDSDEEFESPAGSSLGDDLSVDENPVDDFKAVEDEIDTVQIPINEENNTDYDIVFVGEIFQEMDEFVGTVSCVLDISKTATRILLKHFKWDKDKLMEKYYEGDPEKLFAEAHIGNFLKNNEESKHYSSDTNECQVCNSNVESAECFGLRCGHLFCTNCWDRYFRIKIASIDSISSDPSKCEISADDKVFMNRLKNSTTVGREKMIDTILCAAEGCDAMVEDDTVLLLLKNSEDKSKYQRFILKNFVENNKTLRWCPSSDCNYLVRVKNTDTKLVNCKCGDEFCFSCGESWHEPISCEYLKKWLKKCNDEMETANWISENTKNCPKCGAFIESPNSSSKYMVCCNLDCKYEFCSSCRGDWSKHESYCLWRTNENMPADESRVTLEHFLYCCHRYVHHQHYLKLNQRQYEKIDEKIFALMSKYNQSLTELQYVKEAMKKLCSSRRTLSYYYAFAFYNRNSDKLTVLDHFQKDLQQCVENLSDYLAFDKVEVDTRKLKFKIIHESCRAEMIRKLLLERIREGYEQNWWIYVE